MSPTDTELDDLNRHIAEQMGFLARQRQYIETLKANEEDVTEATRHLASIEETLWQLIDRRKRLLSGPAGKVDS